MKTALPPFFLLALLVLPASAQNFDESAKARARAETPAEFARYLVELESRVLRPWIPEERRGLQQGSAIETRRYAWREAA